jgi:PKD repeat protein
MTGDKFITAHFSASGGGGGGGGGIPPDDDEPPTAIITGPYFGTPNEEIQFDATESHDNDEDGQSIIRYDWKFSDDQEWQEDLGATPIYIYTQPGVYTVTLKVFDDEGNYDTNTTTVTITQPNIPPAIPEINGPNSGTVNISYNYTVVSTDEDGDELKYTIYWGDGTSNESEFLPSGDPYNINHKWAVAGNYTISVTADDGSTISDKDITIKINEPPKLKQKGFDYILLLLLLLLFLILLLIILAKRRKDKEEEQKPKVKPKSN